MIVISDNSNIHKTKEVKLIVKKLRWVEYKIALYSLELNWIEHTYRILKLKISKRNLNGKEFKQIVKVEIIKLHKWSNK